MERHLVMKTSALDHAGIDTLKKTDGVVKVADDHHHHFLLGRSLFIIVDKSGRAKGEDNRHRGGDEGQHELPGRGHATAGLECSGGMQFDIHITEYLFYALDMAANA